MDWTLLIPETTLLITALMFLVLACLQPDSHRDYHLGIVMAVATLAASLICVAVSGDLFHHMYRVDLFSQMVKVLLALGFFLVVFLCDNFKGVDPAHHCEGYFLLAVCTLAMMLMASGVHLLVLVLALELSSYSLYLLVYLRREGRWGLTAGLRYFFVGVSASAVMFFGLALIYAAAGSMHIDILVERLPGMMDQPMAVVGLLMTLAGFFFKLAVFPFHIWAPDAYEGAPNPVATFIAAVSKVAAVAILLRMVSLAQGGGDLLARGLIAMAVVSMTVGNLGAIAQKDFKRLMAFSSVAHAGYLLLAILCMTPDGYAGALFYVAAVMVMKYTCFMVMHRVADDGRNLQIHELAGLHRRSPLLALALMLSLFGLAGIPPTIGFAGKLFIFMAAIKQGYLVLVLIAMANVIVSLYYYLLVLKAAYLDEPAQRAPVIPLSLPSRLVALTLIGIITGLGFFPAPLLDIVQAGIGLLP
jgi:NADH-quinone oxidoreductase subunit N